MLLNWIQLARRHVAPACVAVVLVAVMELVVVSEKVVEVEFV